MGWRDEQQVHLCKVNFKLKYYVSEDLTTRIAPKEEAANAGAEAQGASIAKSAATKPSHKVLLYLTTQLNLSSFLPPGLTRSLSPHPPPPPSRSRSV